MESVREYRYLGVSFAISRSFSYASSEQYKKGLKGFFKLKSIFGTSFPNINVALHLFDHTIKPILNYGSEVWGSCSRKSHDSTRSVDTIYKDLHEEKLHIQFCKHILGVHTKASNMAVLGELCRFPQYNDICENIIKFYLHVKQNSSDSLGGQTLEVSKQLHNDGYKSWFTGVTSILNETELDE